MLLDGDGSGTIRRTLGVNKCWRSLPNFLGGTHPGKSDSSYAFVFCASSLNYFFSSAESKSNLFQGSKESLAEAWKAYFVHNAWGIPVKQLRPVKKITISHIFRQITTDVITPGMPEIVAFVKYLAPLGSSTPLLPRTDAKYRAFEDILFIIGFTTSTTCLRQSKFDDKICHTSEILLELDQWSIKMVAFIARRSLPLLASVNTQNTSHIRPWYDIERIGVWSKAYSSFFIHLLFFSHVGLELSLFYLSLQIFEYLF